MPLTPFEELKPTKSLTYIISFDPYDNLMRKTQQIQMTYLRSESELGKIRVLPSRIFILINDLFYVHLSVPVKHCTLPCLGDVACATSFA